MSTQTTKPLTVRQKAMIAAIDSGVTALRDLMEIADYSSTSVAKKHLEQLAERGDAALITYGDAAFTRAFSGHDFCAAWDASARLAGNPDA